MFILLPGARQIFSGLIVLILAVVASGQEPVAFKTGTFTPIPLSPEKRHSPTPQYLFYTAGRILATPERTELARQGIDILYALQNHIYLVRINRPVNAMLYEDMFELSPEFKAGVDMDARSSSNRYRITIAPGPDPRSIAAWAGEHDITILDTRAISYGVIDIEAGGAAIEPLLTTPWVFYLGAIPQDEEIQFRGQANERSSGLISPLTRGLNGTGITLGIGDGGRLGLHEDLARINDLASFGISTHAMQVSGIIAGKGMINPYWGRGYAPEARVFLRNFSDILFATPQYIQDYGLSITNNSYGAALTNCGYFGDYDGTSAMLDAMMMTHPSLLHVFAAANSGTMTCAPYPPAYATIAGGYQPAKNILTVGAITQLETNSAYSSRGPVDDGRLKPEIVAAGNNRFSTVTGHLFESNSGTSFSSPAVAGIAALLYERYRQLHNDSLPEAALIKNVLCNSADDLGPAGPDYAFGFGRVNGVRAAEILEAGHYAAVEVDHLDTLFIPVPIPAGTAMANVMLLWSDPASAPFETVALVNDLDLAVITPTGDTLHPWRLNSTPQGVAQAASKGKDHINPYEQVTGVSPASGTYTIMITGHHIPLGPQKAWLSWNICPAGIRIQFPDGGEAFRPGNDTVPADQQFIRWDAYGTGTSTFTVAYSANNGATWNTLASNLPATLRYLGWFPPGIASDQVKVRITASNGMTDESDESLVIMMPPANVTVTSPCNGYAQVSWDAVTGATQYQLYSLRNGNLSPLAVSNTTSYLVYDLPADSSVWIAVAGVFPSGKTGLRARAVEITANGGAPCTWDHDLRLDAVTGPATGREYTASALSDNEQVTVVVTNAGMADASGFTLSYQINDGPVHTESFPGNLSSGSSQPFSFVHTVDLSATGLYAIKAWTTSPSDPLPQNDTITQLVYHLANSAISLPWTEDFETLPDAAVTSSITGAPLPGAWDAALTSGTRVRTFAGSGFCYSGDRALTVDAVNTGAARNADLIVTLNLSDYQVALDDIRLSLKAMHHELIPDVSNVESIWLRGSETDSFVLLTYIPNTVAGRGKWQNLPGLPVSGTLEAAGQDFSSSFQIRFAHGVYATAGQPAGQDGQTIDDLSLYRVEKDITLTSVVFPEAASCDLGVETIVVRVDNTTASDVTGIEVHYRINNGVVQATPAGTIAAGEHAFIALDPAFDFSATGTYDLWVWVSSPDDLFAFNDTLRTQVLHTPLVSSFPYTEGFEDHDGGCVTGGIASSWAHGRPGKQIITRAAEGSRVWTTSLNGAYNADEASYLYSPCFDLRGLAEPWLSFAFQYQLELQFDYAWVEYRLEGSADWNRFGTHSNGVNWYNDLSNKWNGNRLKWITTGHAIPATDTTVQFRWVLQSDIGLHLEGVAIDQVHVYDRAALYDGDDTQVSLPVSGNDWVHFSSGGQRIFSIHPEGQDLGMATVEMYKAGEHFIVTDSMYLLSRNWVVHFTDPPVEPVRLRGYFLQSEATQLVNATGCAVCIKARDGFDLAAVQYTGPDRDGAFDNNLPGQVMTLGTAATEIIPFDNGYFAEWTTDGTASEWWIASDVTRWSGALTRNISSAYDDAEEHETSGAVNPVRNRLALTSRDGQQYIGWRFQNIIIPQGSYISSARLEWTSSDTATLPAAWLVQAQMVADAPPFNTSKYNISLRSRSQQTAQWAAGPWSVLDSIYASPEIRHLIQQVTDQPAWVTGNDLVLILRGDGFREAWSYDGDPAKSARLVITYDSLCSTSGICFVDSNATGQQDGTSWTDAYRSLEQALDRAAHCPDIEEIWMAGGTYAPFHETPATFTYAIPAGVRLYGGFAGNETGVAQRVFGAFPTIISGDVGVAGVVPDNLVKLITILPGVEGVWMDGVTVKDGNGN